MTTALRRLIPLGLVLVAGVAAAPPASVHFTDTKLRNGLRVIISEDHAVPVYSIAVQYNVGSRDERKGRTGFAHLFEHMMFKGSENVGQSEHPYLIFMNGGSMNGTTNKDRTMYYETLPANQLDLGLFLESDRPNLRDRGQSRRDHARRARHVSQDAVRSGSCRDRIRRRHLARRSQEARGHEVLRVDEGGRVEASGHGSGACRTRAGLPRRASRLGPDDAQRGHTVHAASRS
jgi:hypothetical protein